MLLIIFPLVLQYENSFHAIFHRENTIFLKSEYNIPAVKYCCAYLTLTSETKFLTKINQFFNTIINDQQLKKTNTVRFSSVEAPGLMRQNNSRNEQFYLLVMYIFSIMEENHTEMSRQEVQLAQLSRRGGMPPGITCHKGGPSALLAVLSPFHSGQAHSSSMLCSFDSPAVEINHGYEHAWPGS